MDIKHWSEISSRYKGSSLILGNGASIAFDGVFDYVSLYDVAYKNLFIDQDLSRLFEKLKTKNFEIVLYRLWLTLEVLNLLRVDTNLVDTYYSLCREALIKTILKTHIKYDKENKIFINKLNKASEFLMNFKTVFSLNYDLILYWVIARGHQNYNSKVKGNIFKDCFVKALTGTNFKLFECDFNFLRRPHRDQKKTVLIFYPHGNLTFIRLIQDQFREIDLKVCSPDEDHLEAIFRTWKNEKYEPVFISEGDHERKKNSILQSEYLRTIYNCGFEEIGQQLAIYGWSISEQDNHILKRLIDIQKARQKDKNNLKHLSKI
jgi:hypothetical protein